MEIYADSVCEEIHVYMHNGIIQAQSVSTDNGTELQSSLFLLSWSGGAAYMEPCVEAQVDIIFIRIRLSNKTSYCT